MSSEFYRRRNDLGKSLMTIDVHICFRYHKAHVAESALRVATGICRPDVNTKLVDSTKLRKEALVMKGEKNTAFA
jgi:hypothetical protein